MADLRSVLDEVLEELGGATAANAESTTKAVANHLLCRELVLLRPEEAADIRSEDTNMNNYPVPAELLPSRELAYPGPPPTFSSYAYNCLVAVLDTIVLEEALAWSVLNFPAREARTLDLFRRLRLRCQKILLELVPPAHDSSAPSSDPEDHLTTALEPLSGAPVAYLEQTEVWDIYQNHGALVRLTLGAPLLNTRTARVPPMFLDMLIIINFDDKLLWTEESTAETLAMLGAPVIPSLTFVHPPPWFIRDFFASELQIQDLQYRMGTVCASLKIRTATGRAFEFVEANLHAVETALFTPAVFRTVTTFVVSDRLPSTTLSRFRKLVADNLTTVEIQFDETYGRERIDETSLLIPRDRRFRLFAKATQLRLVLAPHAAQSLAPLSLMHAFVAAFRESFPPAAVLHLGIGVRIV